MMRWLRAAVLSSTALTGLSAPSAASETQNYSYDALGRLTGSTISGGPNNTIGTATCFDPAGNRTRYTTGAGVTSCGSGTPTPSPTPTPTPSNSPPVANADSLSAPKCAIRFKDVIANDTDPEGNYPLALTAVNQPWAWVENSTTVGMETPATNGSYVITYTVADSLGATSNGSLNVTVTGAGQCA